jgi:hypothetical protein
MAKRAMAWLSVSSVVRLGKWAFLIILVAFGLADGQGHGQVEAAEKMLEIDSILPGGVDTDVLQAVLQSLISGLILQDGEWLGGRKSVRSKPRPFQRRAKS